MLAGVASYVKLFSFIIQIFTQIFKEEMAMKKTLLASAMILAMSSSAFASEGFYVYGGLGYTKADTEMASETIVAGRNYATIDVDEDSVGVKLAAGYRFNDYFAVEGSYVYLGKAEATISSTVDVDAKASMKSHVLAVDAVGLYPINKDFDVFAKAGVGLSYVKTSMSANVFGDSYGFSESDTRFVTKLGFGAEHKVAKNIAIRAEYERYFGVSKDSDYSIDADYDFVSVGVKYTF